MKLTCSQMDVLISFYIEGDLSSALKKQVEEHLESCQTCKAKLEVLEALFTEMKSTVNSKVNLNNERKNSEQYKIFQSNLSAYMDNELPSNENIKIKKFTINNKSARKELQDNYNIRKIMSDSFRKTKNETKADFTRSTLRRLQLEEENALNFNPAIKLLIIFTVSVLILSTIILVSLSV